MGIKCILALVILFASRSSPYPRPQREIINYRALGDLIPDGALPMPFGDTGHNQNSNDDGTPDRPDEVGGLTTGDGSQRGGPAIMDSMSGFTSGTTRTLQGHPSSAGHSHSTGATGTTTATTTTETGGSSSSGNGGDPHAFEDSASNPLETGNSAITTGTAQPPEIEANSGVHDSTRWKVIGITVLTVTIVILIVLGGVFFDTTWGFIRDVFHRRKSIHWVEDFVPDSEKRVWRFTQDKLTKSLYVGGDMNQSSKHKGGAEDGSFCSPQFGYGVGSEYDPHPLEPLVRRPNTRPVDFPPALSTGR